MIALRNLVIAVGAILTCTGIVLIACGVPPGWQALAIGVIVLIGTLFERWRYRRTACTQLLRCIARNIRGFRFGLAGVEMVPVQDGVEA